LAPQFTFEDVDAVVLLVTDVGADVVELMLLEGEAVVLDPEAVVLVLLVMDVDVWVVLVLVGLVVLVPVGPVVLVPLGLVVLVLLVAFPAEVSAPGVKMTST
jgi:hypothetical protein